MRTMFSDDRALLRLASAKVPLQGYCYQKHYCVILIGKHSASTIDYFLPRKDLIFSPVLIYGVY